MKIAQIFWLCTAVVFRFVSTASLKGVEEQFVEGEFPFWPYNRNSDKYSLEIDSQLSKESSGSQKVAKRRVQTFFEAPAVGEVNNLKVKPPAVKRDHGSSFYEIKPGRGLTLARVDAIEKSLKTVADPKRIFSKKSKRVSRAPSNNRPSHNKRNGHHSKVKRENLQFEIPFAGAEGEKSESPNERIARENLQNDQPQVFYGLAQMKEPADNSSKYQLISVEDFLHSKPGEEIENCDPLTKPVSNFNVTGECKKNSNSWLVNQIEKLVKHKNPRLLEFKPDKGKYRGVMIDSKHHLPKSKPRFGERATEDSGKSNAQYEALVQRIDSILEGLTELKTSSRKGRSPLTGQRHQGSPRLKRLARILADKLILERPVSISRDTRSAKSAKSKIASKSRINSKSQIASKSRFGSIDDDLQELQKNLILIGPKQIGTPDNSQQDLKNLRLHIKVYVENTDSLTERAIEKTASS